MYYYWLIYGSTYFIGSNSDESWKPMREVACPICTVHLQVYNIRTFIFLQHDKLSPYLFIYFPNWNFADVLLGLNSTIFTLSFRCKFLPQAPKQSNVVSVNTLSWSVLIDIWFRLAMPLQFLSSYNSLWQAVASHMLSAVTLVVYPSCLHFCKWTFVSIHLIKGQVWKLCFPRVVWRWKPGTGWANK